MENVFENKNVAEAMVKWVVSKYLFIKRTSLSPIASTPPSRSSQSQGMLWQECNGRNGKCGRAECVFSNPAAPSWWRTSTHCIAASIIIILFFNIANVIFILIGNITWRGLSDYFSSRVLNCLKFHACHWLPLLPLWSAFDLRHLAGN